MNEANFVTVSQVNEYIKAILSSDENLTGLFIRGEISNFTHHLKSGHFYFTLKDEKASIKAVMFKGSARYVRFRPENGMKVVIFGSIRVFERDGIYQLYCEDMQPDGVGALYMAYEQLKKKLELKGYFDADRKRPIPQLPQKIVLLTAQTGAALQDILSITARRYPLVRLMFLPVMVQGELAPASIAAAFDYLNKQTDDFTDLIILARGGGSIEDLSAFNTEAVADAVFGSKFPVISAVGHETDYTISDFVADLRAPTPSAAAELAVPDRKIILDTLDNYQNILYNYTLSAIKRLEQKLDRFEEQIRLLSPQKTLADRKEKLERSEKALMSRVSELYKRRNKEFVSTVELLEALSPLKVLMRGYSATFSDGVLLTDSKDVAPGKMIETKLNHGTILSEVKEIYE